MRWLVSATLLVAALAMTAACGDDAPARVAAVTLQPTSLELMEGTDSTLVATVIPKDAADKTVAWSSSDSTVVAVTSGRVSALQAGGPVTITVTTLDGGFTATCTVMVVLPPGLKVSTVAGDGVAGHVDATGTAARFSDPQGIVADATGKVYVGESAWIRMVAPSGAVSTLAGGGSTGYVDGIASAARFREIAGLALDAAGNLYAADYGNYCVRKISPSGTVTTLAGNGTAGYAEGTGKDARMGATGGVAISPSGEFLYVTDMTNNCVWKIVIATGAATTLAGNSAAGHADGPGPDARFNAPRGICVDAAGNLYVTEYFGQRIRKITPSGEVSTVAGSGTEGFRDATALSAMFSYPMNVVVDTDGNLLVADTRNYCVRRINSSGEVSTLAGIPRQKGYLDGPAGSAQFDSLSGMTVGVGGVVYVLERSKPRLRQIAFE